MSKWAKRRWRLPKPDPGPDMSDYWDLPQVCVTHKAFIPCRRTTFDCVLSDAQEDVAMVAAYHREQEQGDDSERVPREEAGGDGSSS